MTNTPEALPTRVNIALRAVQYSRMAADADSHVAAGLHSRADRIVAEAQVQLGNSVAHAVDELRNAALEGTISNPLVLGSILAIRESMPTSGKEAADDTDVIMGNFNALVPGEPVIFTPSSRTMVRGGVVTEHPVTIEPSREHKPEARLDAKTQFGIRLADTTRREPELQDETLEAIDLRTLAGLIIGPTAIEAFMNSLRPAPLIPSGGSGPARRRRLDVLERYAKMGELFNNELGANIDLANLRHVIKVDTTELYPPSQIRTVRPATPGRPSRKR